MNFLYVIILLLSFSSSCIFSEILDLEKEEQKFILELKRIEVPGFPHAFNPSIVRWGNEFLMSFRDIPNPKFKYISRIGLIWLDEDFSPIGEAQILETREKTPLIPSRSEDPRLIAIGDRVFIIYSDNIEEMLSRSGFRMHVAELKHDGNAFYIDHVERITRYPNPEWDKREKNWAPFEYNDNLMLAYSLVPHCILKPIWGTGACEQLSSTDAVIPWEWGELRGGTPAILDEGQYLAFFHSSKKIQSVHSKGENVIHYVMGAYTFSPLPPFPLTQVSPEPIIARGFYSGNEYKPYWHPVRAVFPCGLYLDRDYVWVSYGRQDHEIWIVKLDKRELLRSLIPITSG